MIKPRPKTRLADKRIMSPHQIKAERKCLKELANVANGKRQKMRVILPPIITNVFLESPDKAWEQWEAELTQRTARAIAEIAEERGADLLELVKVADFLIEYVAPDARGKHEKDIFGTLLRVAVAMNERQTQVPACETAEVDVKTFRALKRDNPQLWNFVVDAAEHLESPLSYIDPLLGNKK